MGLDKLVRNNCRLIWHRLDIPGTRIFDGAPQGKILATSCSKRWLRMISSLV